MLLAAYNSFLSPATAKESYHDVKCYINRLFEILAMKSELINVKKIFAVINATYAVAKRKPEKIRLAGIRTLTSAIPVQRSNQLR